MLSGFWSLVSFLQVRSIWKQAFDYVIWSLVSGLSFSPLFTLHSVFSGKGDRSAVDEVKMRTVSLSRSMFSLSAPYYDLIAKSSPARCVGMRMFLFGANLIMLEK